MPDYLRDEALKALQVIDNGMMDAMSFVCIVPSLMFHFFARRYLLPAHRPGGALEVVSRNRCTSRIGGMPKRFLYSRLKWEASW